MLMKMVGKFISFVGTMFSCVCRWVVTKWQLLFLVVVDSLSSAYSLILIDSLKVNVHCNRNYNQNTSTKSWLELTHALTNRGYI